MFDQESIWPVASPICGGFEEYSSPPMYDKYEDRYSEDEGPKWDVSSCSYHSEPLFQEELSLLEIIEDTPCEMHE